MSVLYETAMNTQVCGWCDHHYELDRLNSVCLWYVLDPRWGHIKTECPLCGVVSRIYSTSDRLRHIVMSSDLRVLMSRGLAPEVVQRQAMVAQESGEVEVIIWETPKLPKVPRQLIRDFDRWMREFGGEDD